VLDGLVPPVTDRREPGPEVGPGATYADAERNASVLLDGDGDGGTTVVVHDGERYRVTVGESEPVTLKTHRYDAIRVAGSAEAYADRIEREYAFALSDADLDDAEQSVVETAIENGSYVAENDDEAFRSVVEQFRDREALTEGTGTGPRVVRHEGERYVVDLRYGGFDVE